MSRFVIATVLLLDFFLLTACGKAADSTPLPRTLDSQAREVTIAQFSKYWSQCGESWFTQQPVPGKGYFNSQNFDYAEQRGVLFETVSGEISEGQRLNGVEWQGQVVVAGSVYRLHFPPGLPQIPLSSAPPPPGWSQWFDGRDLLPRFHLTKIQGRWSYDDPFQNSPLRAVSCDDVSKIDERLADRRRAEEHATQERNKRISESAKTLVGTWRDENSTFTYSADGTGFSKADNGTVAKWSWHVDNDIIQRAKTEQNGKRLPQPLIYRSKIIDISNSRFITKNLDDDSEWHATRLK